MTSRRELAKSALGAALRLRRRAGISLENPLCPFDLAEQLGIEVWFTDITSMEAMYVDADRPSILIAGNRFPGRQAYDCGHELGHHVFRHGSRIDKIIAESGSPQGPSTEEFLANVFAGFLLMPKAAVVRGFRTRGWAVETCSPEQASVVAGWLGVSYAALITHLTWSLALLSREHSGRLMRARLGEIRVALGGPKPSSPLVVVDKHWKGRAIDVRVEDFILAPSGATAEERIVEVLERRGTGVLLRAICPGIGRLLLPDGTWSSYIRVARQGYVGRCIYRHLEDPDGD